MTTFARAGLLVVAAATAMAAVGTLAVAQEKKAAAKCVLAGGEATMITTDLAKFMAGAALKNSISGMGAKPAGDVKMTCKDGTATVYCLAQQRACK